MSKNLITVLTFAIIFSAVSCRVARDAPNNTDSSISDIYNEITKGVKIFEENVMQVLGVKNSDDFQKKAVETGKDIAAKFDVWSNDIKKTTENWKELPIIKNIQETAEKTASDFKMKNPQTAEEIKSFYESLSKGTEEIVEKIKAIDASEDANKLKDLSKKLLETASNTVQNIANDVQESLKKQ